MDRIFNFQKKRTSKLNLFFNTSRPPFTWKRPVPTGGWPTRGEQQWGRDGLGEEAIITKGSWEVGSWGDAGQCTMIEEVTKNGERCKGNEIEVEKEMKSLLRTTLFRFRVKLDFFSFLISFVSNFILQAKRLKKWIRISNEKIKIINQIKSTIARDVENRHKVKSSTSPSISASQKSKNFPCGEKKFVKIPQNILPLSSPD